MGFRGVLGRSVVFLCFVALLPAAEVPTPKEHFGFTPGDDYKLFDYAELVGYYEKIAKVSDRIKLVEFGKSSEGKPMYVAFFSDSENLKQLDHYRDISRTLALGIADPREATRLSNEGKAIVWIDSGLHASEVAPAQHSPELAYKMLTDDSDELRRIRHNVILLQVPAINPDGLDHIVHWYRKNVGTPYELAPLPWLYQKYSGHDNNRDWYMLNLMETRNVSRLLFREWFPQIVYNQHQAPQFPARIFVPPYAEPLNPNIPAAVMEGINLIGSAMKERFAREEKPGILSYYGFDAWWNGGLRSVPAFHNMHGILTETALFDYATPHTYQPADLPERFPNGIPTKEPTVFYERPWVGGKWGVRNAIEYMLTADFAILDLAASRAPAFLHKSWEMARKNMEGAKGSYVVPDSENGRELARRLIGSGVQVKRSRADNTYVVEVAQPFRGYIVDLFEPQKYPDLRAGTSGPTKRPYDIAGWTLPMLMGVSTKRLDAAPADLEPVGDLRAEERSWTGKSRVAVYEPFTANMDAGWTQWVFDTFKIPYTLLHNSDIRRGGLHDRFDVLVLASQGMQSILHGVREGERNPGRADHPVESPQQRPEYTGGIEIQGLAQLQQFVQAGGTLIAFDAATELPVTMFPLPVRPLVRSAAAGENREEDIPVAGYYCPGSILRIDVQKDDPVAKGLAGQAYVFSSGGQAWDITLLPEYNKGDREVRVIATYAKTNVLASGWLSGESVVAGKAILVDARYGKGHVLLFGFRPQFRGQTFGTFPFLFNAIETASRP